MQDVVQCVRECFGVVYGVLYMVGVVDDDFIVFKMQVSVDEVFMLKIQGMMVFDQVFVDGVLSDVVLDFMVFFSLIFIVIVPVGQVDYVVVNIFFDVYVESKVGGLMWVILVYWGIWSQVGMVVVQFMDDVSVHVGELVGEQLNYLLLLQWVCDVCGEVVLQVMILLCEDWIFDGYCIKVGYVFIFGMGYFELVCVVLCVLGEQGLFEVEDFFFICLFVVLDDVE